MSAKAIPSGSNSEPRTTRGVLAALRRIIRAIDLHSRTLVQRYGLTGPQLVVLKELAENSPQTVSELAHAVNLSQATLTGILDRLDRKGLVERVRSTEDRRKVIVSFTDAAETLIAQAPPLLQEHFTYAFSGLPEWEQNQILSSLQRIVALMEAESVEAGPILSTGPLDASSEGTGAFLERLQPDKAKR